MRKEYICKECGGSGYVAQGKYFQGFGDSMQGICCPSCNGTGHIPLSEMLMLVNEALCDANRAFREGLRWEEGRSVTNIIEKLEPEKIDGYYKKWCIYRAEHYLALAVVRLREIAGVIGIPSKNDKSDFYRSGWTNISADIRMIIRIVDQVDCSFAINLITGLCNHHKIDLSAHIEALVTYEKEGEE